MGIFKKPEQNIVNIEPQVSITNPVIVPVGSVLLTAGKAYRAESYALVEIPIQKLEVETE